MRCIRFQLALLAVPALGLTLDSYAQVRSVDTVNSKVIVHAFKSGILSGFADNHEVEAMISEGSVDEGKLHVKFVVDSRHMKVLDPQLSPDQRRQVEERMLGPEVLDSAHYPRIVFESTNIEHVRQDQFVVGGRLSLRGVTRPVSAMVRKEVERYVGMCTLKQRDFGINPISIAGGTVKVKDELKIEFDVRATGGNN